MDSSTRAASDAPSEVSRRYVEVRGRAVHYRFAGEGPAVVLLHDSPRSSRLHLATIQALSRRFQVFALDTPGYGQSEPLALADPTIADFAAALGATLDALGLSQAPLYATHTSAKIALEYAANEAPKRTAPVILDGLSIPVGKPDPAFISAYMRPFQLDQSGGYLAAEWTRMRDMLRWFPWFDHTPERRMPIATPGEQWISDYVIDFLSAGPSYSSAYSAAMYYDPMPALLKVKCPLLVATKPDDVLYSSLDRVPMDDNAALAVKRLAAGHEAWFAWLEQALANAATATTSVEPPAQPEQGWRYVDVPHGTMRVRRSGPSSGTPILLLSAPTTLEALAWQAALPDVATMAPELPGFGESTPLPSPTLDAGVDALAAMLDDLHEGPVDVVACGLATPLGSMLAQRHPHRVRKVVLDGCFEGDARAAEQLCPEFPFDMGGGHLHRIWHMLRDSQASWPWHDRSAEARRAVPPIFDAQALHDALVGVLKQPAHYGDLATAACLASDDQRYPGASRPILLLHRDGDPASSGTAHVAQRLSGSTVLERPADLANTAALAREFLRSDGPSA